MKMIASPASAFTPCAPTTHLSPASSVPSFCQPATIVPAAWGLSGLEYLDEWAGGSVGELALEGRVEVLLVARTDHTTPDNTQPAAAARREGSGKGLGLAGCSRARRRWSPSPPARKPPAPHRLSPGWCRWQRAAGAHDYEAVVEAAVVEVEELRAVEGAAAVDARAGLARHPALRVCGVGVREGSGSQPGGRGGERGRTDVVDAEGGQAVPRQPCPQSRTPSATFRLLLLPRSKGGVAGRQEGRRGGGGGGGGGGYRGRR